jgi:hypothetical protein
LEVGLKVKPFPLEVLRLAAVNVRARWFVTLAAAQLVIPEFNETIERMRRELATWPAIKLFQVKVSQRPD